MNLDLLKDERTRKPINHTIVKKALDEVDKIAEVSFTKKVYEGMFWGDNPNKENPLTIDIEHIEMEPIPFEKDFVKNAVFINDVSGYKVMDKSCVITHNGEVMMVYLTNNEMVNMASKYLTELGEKMKLYYPKKDSTFYTPFKLGAKTPEAKKDAYEMKRAQNKTARYSGFNYMDGQIRYFATFKPKDKAPVNTTVISYQPRKIEANDDEDFLYYLVYTYCALYEIEKICCPDVANYRLKLAKGVDFAGAFPNVPLERHCATGCGASYNFASSIHNDSGIKGLSETIIWTKPSGDNKQYFVSPTLNMVFDLSQHNACILQPPKIPHGTVFTGDHGGYGFVNITKQNIVNPTALNKGFQAEWRKKMSE